VILVDANLLLYAVNADAPEHGPSKAWLDHALSGPTRVGLAWPSLLAFVRLSSNPVVVRNPQTSAAAWEQVRDWLGAGVVWIPVPGDRHADILGPLITMPMMSSRLVSDAHLAALAIEHGLTLCSTDGDFAKFPGLKWQNPLSAANRDALPGSRS
jgi:toxin-antitoxin system PIN domain toxin